MTQSDLKDLTHFTQQAVTKAADFIRANAGKVGNDQVEEKFLNGLVSYVDRTAEEILVEALGRYFPEAQFITEEETTKQGTGNDLCWVIDPLDGTTNFLFGLPHYAVSVALAQGSELLVGVVCNVPQNELFTAWKGGGARLNGLPIAVSKHDTLRNSLAATGFPYHDFGRLAEWQKTFDFLMRETRGIRRFGAAALDLAYVACGRYDLFYEYGLAPWDVAAGALLVQEAGGTVTDCDGGDRFLFGQEILAGNGRVNDLVLKQGS